jgi:hypothetical protein
MRTFFVASVASFAVMAAICATAAVTIWLWSYLDMERAIGLHDLSAVGIPGW